MTVGLLLNKNIICGNFRPPSLWSVTQNFACYCWCCNQSPCSCVHQSVLGHQIKTPTTTYLGTRWRRVVNFTHRPLYLRKWTPVPIEQEVWGGGDSRAGLYVLEKMKNLPLPEIEWQFLELKSPELVTVPTKLSRYCSCGRITIPTSDLKWLTLHKNSTTSE